VGFSITAINALNGVFKKAVTEEGRKKEQGGESKLEELKKLLSASKRVNVMKQWSWKMNLELAFCTCYKVEECLNICKSAQSNLTVRDKGSHSKRRK